MATRLSPFRRWKEPALGLCTSLPQVLRIRSGPEKKKKHTLNKCCDHLQKDDRGWHKHFVKTCENDIRANASVKPLCSRCVAARPLCSRCVAQSCKLEREEPFGELTHGNLQGLLACLIYLEKEVPRCSSVYVPCINKKGKNVQFALSY